MKGVLSRIDPATDRLELIGAALTTGGLGVFLVAAQATPILALAPLIAARPGLRAPGAWDGFVAAVDGVRQLASGEAGAIDEVEASGIRVGAVVRQRDGGTLSRELRRGEVR
jgi:hypothetical protein